MRFEDKTKRLELSLSHEALAEQPSPEVCSQVEYVRSHTT